MKRIITKKAQKHGLICHEDSRWDLSESRYCVETEHIRSPRGTYYNYALLDVDGNIIALGSEQGNYAGGIYAWKGATKEYQKIENNLQSENLPSSFRDFLNDISI